MKSWLFDEQYSIEIDWFYLSHFEIFFFFAEYSKERIILVVINIDVRRINNNCMNRLISNVYLKYNNNILVESKIKKKYNDECFYIYDEISLSSFVFRFKIDMSIMIIRNLKLLVICNDIRARFAYIDRNVLKIKVINEMHIDIKILISRISLQSKDDESNRKRKRNMLYIFIKRQYFIRSTIVMTINLSQSQSHKNLDVDIRTREIFTQN